MANRRRLTGRGGRAPLRKFVWARSEAALLVAAQDSTTVNLFQAFEAEYGAQLLGATVMRIRGRLRFAPASPVFATAAAAIRVAVDGQPIEGPKAAKHADWMAYQPIILGLPTGLTSDNFDHDDWDIDVKSSRKVEELGEALMLVIENPVVGVALNVSGLISVGLKLP